ncbi:TetR/AcrR family transcriptional regulator [Lichenihabitans sp. Uapishka_5]|uniref:TetR/AcrR family transcriptional regulator n=1 Tax=Lichenihabitans sp. Uapishka_5 TaxID=3037302 RepID=UPI0029E7D873|nr:TetR/AcrR family transcriptional regulator [Lichenihabitans sp. Uapishka_5]MDX7953790.1 TetR/AcrR family transcriptional regulator [Lichenihabitans sp. Uapishka_5]
MEAARLTVQDLGYGGLSFRELAKDVGIKSASIHYHFPTKGELVVAILRDYTAYHEALLHGIETEGADGGALLRHYTDMFRRTLLNGNRMCLAGMLSAERNELPEGVGTELVRWGEMNEGWIARVLGPGDDGDADWRRHRARAIFAAVSGAQMIAHGRNDIATYDEVIVAYRGSGLIP